MLPDAAERLQMEMAHVLYADMVGFSRELLEEQVRRKQILVSVVRAAPEFRRAEERNDVLLLDTGDGVILIFFRDWTASLRCAMEITAALQQGANLSLRMGIHTGPIVLTTDANGRPNVTGPGINLGERVMSSGDGGHILLSEDSAKHLLVSAEWQGKLHRLGEFTVKHDVVLTLYNYYDGAIGNPAAPSKIPSAPQPITAILKPALPPEQARSVGGAVRLGSQYYIERPTDAAFLGAVRQQDSIALVKGARQMGKSSLLARGLAQARQEGAKVVLTDFQEFDATAFASADTLLRALANQLADELDLAVAPEEFWSAKRNPNANLWRYLQTHVLSAFSEPLVWGMDEVDKVFAYPFAGDFFSLIRVLHNRRAFYPDESWSRLTFAIAHSTEPALFITDMTTSPFNVGTRLMLDDFTLDQLAELNRCYDTPLHNENEVSRVYALLNGHPYLSSKALYEIRENGLTLDTLETQADKDTGPFGEHLRHLLQVLAQSPELAKMVRGVLRNEPCTDEVNFYRLRSAGILIGASALDARLRCTLYARYFAQHPL